MAGRVAAELEVYVRCCKDPVATATATFWITDRNLGTKTV